MTEYVIHSWSPWQKDSSLQDVAMLHCSSTDDLKHYRISVGGKLYCHMLIFGGITHNIQNLVDTPILDLIRLRNKDANLYYNKRHRDSNNFVLLANSTVSVVDGVISVTHYDKLFEVGE